MPRYAKTRIFDNHCLHLPPFFARNEIFVQKRKSRNSSFFFYYFAALYASTLRARFRAAAQSRRSASGIISSSIRFIK